MTLTSSHGVTDAPHAFRVSCGVQRPIRSSGGAGQARPRPAREMRALWCTAANENNWGQRTTVEVQWGKSRVAPNKKALSKGLQ